MTTTALLLFEHEDGRYMAAADSSPTCGDPRWHRVGPVTVNLAGMNEQDRLALAAHAERAAAAKQAQRLTGGRVVHHLDGDALNNDLANLATTRPRPNPRVPNR